jgi:hypothetical protein
MKSLGRQEHKELNLDCIGRAQGKLREKRLLDPSIGSVSRVSGRRLACSRIPLCSWFASRSLS